MTAACSHCGHIGPVSLYRLFGVGLRWLLPEHATFLAAMGLGIELVGDTDPRARQRRERVA